MINKDPIFFLFLSLPFLISLWILICAFVVRVFCLLRDMWRE